MMATNARPCCGEDSCIRREIADLLQADAPITDQVCMAACVVAQTCSKLSEDDLHRCAAQLFDVPPECALTNAFVIAHQTECDAMAERRESERLRSLCRG